MSVSFDQQDVERLLRVVNDARLGGTFQERFESISASLRRLVPTAKLTAVTVRLDAYDFAAPGDGRLLRVKSPEWCGGHVLSDGITPEDGQAYHTHFVAFDPTAARVVEAGGAAVCLGQLLGASAWGRDEFTSDYLDGRLRARRFATIAPPITRGTVLAMGFFRDARAHEFEARELALLTLVAPSLARAALGAIVTERLATGDGAGAGELEQEVGVVVTDELGVPRDADPTARAILDKLSTSAGDALLDLARSLTLSGRPRIRSTHTTQDGRWVDLQASRVERRGDLVVLVRLVAPETVRHHELTLDTLGLTPRERQVAERVVAGRADSEIAYELGVSIHTVKQHLKRVYAKAGVRGRVELARLVLGGTSA